MRKQAAPQHAHLSVHALTQNVQHITAMQGDVFNESGMLGGAGLPQPTDIAHVDTILQMVGRFHSSRCLYGFRICAEGWSCWGAACLRKLHPNLYLEF